MIASMQLFRRGILAISLLGLLVVYSPWFPQILGQDATEPVQAVPISSPVQPDAPALPLSSEAVDPQMTPSRPRLSILELYVAGGVLMYPISAMSLIALAFALERFWGLRRARHLPRRQVAALKAQLSDPAGPDLTQVADLCVKYPSTLSKVLKVVLIKAGRSTQGFDQAITEAVDREATQLYANVRPIALAVTISPLIGLLGTVQGMILAFYDTAYAPIGVNKATFLATGIYVALITTFAGLCVAIPASVMVHYFEGRILKIMQQVDDLVRSFVPYVEQATSSELPFRLVQLPIKSSTSSSPKAADSST